MTLKAALHPFIEIEHRKIGSEYPPLVIAEAGVNHNGDVDIAKRLILEAKRVGAEAIKFQTFKAEKLVTQSAKTASYQNTSTGESNQLRMLKQLELSNRDLEKLKSYCDELEIIFLSTPMTKSDIDVLSDLNVSGFKVASPDIVSLPMLEYISKKKKPIMISTGMASLAEIKNAIATLSRNTQEFAVMQCTSSYPCDLSFINLNVISSFLQKFNRPIGFSDHSLGIGCAIAAVQLGASIIEKHFTLSRNMLGPDHAMSLEPRELQSLIKGSWKSYERRDKGMKSLVSLLNHFDPIVAGNLDRALGSFKKKLTPPEREIRLKTRKSIVPSRAITKGTQIPDDIFSVWEDLFLFKRPGNGLQPKFLYKLLGKITNRDLRPDEPVKLSYFY